MMILLHVWPEKVYKFSTRKFLPSKKNKFSKKIKPNIPFELLKSKSNSMPMMNEINIVCRGSSFDYNNLKKIKGPTFLASFFVPLKIDDYGNVIYTYETLRSKKHGQAYGNAKHNYDISNSHHLKEFKKTNLTYVMPRKEYVEALQKKNKVLSIIVYFKNKNGIFNVCCDKTYETPKYLKFFKKKNSTRISVGDNNYLFPLPENYMNFAPTGSVLPTVCALSFFAKKINIYGWDFYLPFSPKKMNYLQLLMKMYNYDTDGRSKNHFECALLNFYYGYHLSRLPNFKIHGYMGELKKHKKLISRIEKVLFN